MLTHEQNERLTRVGPGTPGGELLRRYWQAVCPTKELSGERAPKARAHPGRRPGRLPRRRRRVRCIHEHARTAARRCTSASSNRTEFAAAITAGSSTARPARASSGRSRPPRRTPDIAIEGLSGAAARRAAVRLHGARSGNAAPLLPRWDVMARPTGRARSCVMPVHNCNWLQIQENTVDTVHTYYLHGHCAAVQSTASPIAARSTSIARSTATTGRISHWGIEKTLEYGGEQPGDRNPAAADLPEHLAHPGRAGRGDAFPRADRRRATRIIWVGLLPAGAAPIAARRPVPYEVRLRPARTDRRERSALRRSTVRIASCGRRRARSPTAAREPRRDRSRHRPVPAHAGRADRSRRARRGRRTSRSSAIRRKIGSSSSRVRPSRWSARSRSTTTPGCTRNWRNGWATP